VKTVLSRFAGVGAAVTAGDVACFLVLRATGLALAPADAAAILVASLLSYSLHRAITFRDSPHQRWLERPRTFVWSSAIALVVDVLVVVGLATALDAGLWGALVAKLVAVGAAGTVRWRLHRRVLFTIVRADRVPRPGRPAAPGTARLSVVIPAYCEESRIADTVGRVRAALAPIAGVGGVEVVVVDDGSPDTTAAAARTGGADQVVVQPRNRGKGAAVRAGVLAANGRTIAFTDADLAYPPEQLVGLLEEVEAGWDMVVGSRRHANTVTLARARRLREVGGRAINWITYLVVLGRYRDTQCGIKAFRSDVARELFLRSRIDGFAFDIELFVIAERTRMAVTEVPVHVENAERSTVRVVRDAARVVRDVFRIRRWARQGAYSPAATEPAEVAPAGQ